MTFADPNQSLARSEKQPAETEAERDRRHTRTYLWIAALVVSAALSMVSFFGLAGLAITAVALVPVIVACLVLITWG